MLGSLKMASSVGVRNHVKWILWRLVENLLHLKNLLKLLSLYLWYYHTIQRQKVNIQNPQNEYIVDEPVDNVQVTNEQEQMIEETQEITVRQYER